MFIRIYLRHALALEIVLTLGRLHSARCSRQRWNNNLTSYDLILKLSSILTPPFEDPDAMYACPHILEFRVRISY